MIGMTFGSFLTLAVESLIAAAVLQYAVRYRVLAGFDGFLDKWVIGWLGAWVGAAILGYWGGTIFGVYWLPGLIGAFSAPFLAVALLKATRKLAAADASAAAQPPQIEMRKAS